MGVGQAAGVFDALAAVIRNELENEGLDDFAHGDANAEGFAAVDAGTGRDEDGVTAVLADFLRTKVNGVQGITGKIGFTDKGDREGVPMFLYVVDDQGKIVISK